MTYSDKCLPSSLSCRKCRVQWNNTVKQLALVGSYNTAVRPRPVLRAEPGYCTVYNIRHGKMLTKCTERIQDGCPQQRQE